MSIDEISILGEVVRVVVSDGRVLEGTLLCFDQLLNVVLGDTKEYRTL